MGGANSHIILDDAFHYLQEHGLSGFHHCNTSSTGHAGGTVNGNTAIHGHVVNGASANGASANGISVGQPSPKLLICSAADARAADRMIQAYQSYYQAHVSNNHRKLDQLAYTLGTRRSIMPWRTFAVVDGAHGNDDRSQLTFATPVRASPEKASIGLVLTGQGAQYAGMGLELLQYPVFESSLRTSNEIFASLGAEWSLLGEWRKKFLVATSNADNSNSQMHFAMIKRLIFPGSASHYAQRCKSPWSTSSAASASLCRSTWPLKWRDRWRLHHRCLVAEIGLQGRIFQRTAGW